MSEIKIFRTNKDSILPQKKHSTDSGFDLYSIEEYTLKPLERKLFSVGIKMVLPEYKEAQIRARSGLTCKHGVTVINGVGTVDYSYRGDIKVGLINLSDIPYKVCKGDRIAQMVISDIDPNIIIKEVSENEITNTERGAGGFGSTGK